MAAAPNAAAEVKPLVSEPADVLFDESALKAALALAVPNSRHAIRLSHQILSNRALTEDLKLPNFRCEAKGCECGDLSAAARDDGVCTRGGCGHASALHAPPTPTQLFEHCNAVSVFTEEDNRACTADDIRHANAKFAALRYLNWTDVAVSGFRDCDTRPSGGFAAAAAGVEIVTSADAQTDATLSYCMLQAKNKIGAIKSPVDRCMELGQFVANWMSDSSAAALHVLASPRAAPARKRSLTLTGPAQRVLELGRLIGTNASARHRALLFKFLADRCGVECQFVASAFTHRHTSDDTSGVAWAMVDRSAPKLVDLMSPKCGLFDPNSVEARRYMRYGSIASVDESKAAPPQFETIATPYGEFGAFERVLGDGAMSLVRLTKWKNRSVVLKELRPYKPPKGTRPDPTAPLPEEYDTRMFEREIGGMTQFTHPHIVALHAACDNTPARFSLSPHAAATAPPPASSTPADQKDAPPPKTRFAVILEFVNGGTLKSYIIRHHRTLPLSERLRLLLQCGDALHAIHLHGTVHRDIKPENVLIATATAPAPIAAANATSAAVDGWPPAQIKIADFGLSRNVSSAGVVSTVNAGAGTITYLSPEQVEGAAITDRIDSYAFGGLIFFCVFGAEPWDGKTANQIIFAHLSKRLPPPPVAAAVKGDSPFSGPDAVSAAPKTDVPATAAGAVALDAKSQPASASGDNSVLSRAVVLMYRCLSYDPTTRPSMHDIVYALRELYDCSLPPRTVAAPHIAGSRPVTPPASARAPQPLASAAAATKGGGVAASKLSNLLSKLDIKS